MDNNKELIKKRKDGVAKQASKMIAPPKVIPTEGYKTPAKYKAKKEVGLTEKRALEINVMGAKLKQTDPKKGRGTPNTATGGLAPTGMGSGRTVAPTFDQDEYLKDAMNKQLESRATLDRLGNINRATTTDKLKAIGWEFSKGSAIGGAVNKFVDLNMVPEAQNIDRNFKDGLSIELVNNALVKSGATTSQLRIETLLGANNQLHFDYLLDQARTASILDDLSKNALGDTAILTSNLVGDIGTDPLTAMAGLTTIIPKTIVKAKGAMGIVATAGTSFGISTAMQGIREYADPSLTLDDHFIGIGAGVLADTFTTKLMAGRYLREDQALAARAKYAQQLDDAVRGANEAYEMGRHFNPSTMDVSEGYKWSAKYDTVHPTTRAEFKPKSDGITTPPSGMKLPVGAEFKPVTVAQTIPTYKIVGRGAIATAIKESGLSKTAFKEINDNIDEDLPKLLEEVNLANTKMPKEKLKALNALEKAANTIEGVSPEAAKILREAVDKARDVTTLSPNKITVDKAGKVALTRGVFSFKENLRKIEAIRVAGVVKINTAMKEIADTKMMKALGENPTFQKAKTKLDVVGAEITKLEASLASSKLSGSVDTISAKKLSDLKRDAGMLNKILDILENSEQARGLKELSKQKELYSRMASAIDELLFDMSRDINVKMLDSLPDQEAKKTFLDNMSRDLTTFLGTDIKVVIKDGELAIEGTLKLNVEGGAVKFNNKLIKVGAVLALGGSTALMADSGDSVDIVGNGLILVAAIFGINFVATASKEHGGILNAIKQTAQKAVSVLSVSEELLKPEVQARMSINQKLAEKMSTGYMYSYRTVEQYGSDFAKRLLSELVENPTGHTQVSAEVVQKALVRTALNRIGKADKEAFGEYMKERGIGFDVGEKVTSMGTKSPTKVKFDELVSDGLEKPKNIKSPAIQKLVQTVRGEIDDVYKRAEELDIFGIKDAPKVKNYLPRYTIARNIRTLAGNPESKELLIKSITASVAKAIGKSPDNEDAIRMASSWVEFASDTAAGRVTNKSVDRVIQGMESLGVKVSDINKEELLLASSTSDDALGRLQARIPMHLDAFIPFNTKVNGVDAHIEMNSIFVRDYETIVTRYFSEMNGQFALKERVTGFTTEAALRTLINKEPNPEVADTLNMYLNSITGKPQYDSSSVFNRNIDAIRNASYPLLIGTTLTMTKEMISTVASVLTGNIAVKDVVREIANVFRDIPKTDEMMEELMYAFNGSGGAVTRKEVTVKGIDFATNTEEISDGLISKTGNQTKGASLWLSRLIHADDSFKRLAYRANMNRLYDMAHNGSTMSIPRMDSYGIDASVLKLIKEKAVKTENGNIILGIQKWSRTDQNKLRAVVHQMTQQFSLEVTTGGIPKAFVNNPAGRLLGLLGSFTAQMYSTHFIRGLKHLDGEEYLNQLSWLMGGVITAMAKDKILGDGEITEDEIMKRAIMSSPALSPLSVMHLFSSPVYTGVAQEAMEDLSATANLVGGTVDE